MSDEIFEVLTPYNDVAELGHGYVDRADGERILLALPRACEDGEGVRFIVHLADGTPAFAGAGRCVQVSDQGAGVPAEQRYETLVDALAFDERSQPVYDYIVAVRQMAYADAAAQANEEPVAEAVYESEEPAPFSQPPAQVEMTPPADPDVTLEVDAALAVPVSQPAAAYAEEAAIEVDAQAGLATDRPARASSHPVSQVPTELAPEVMASVLPEPLPRGMLKRPAIAAHWAPAAPRAPRPSGRPSRFRYAGGKLPIPDAAPRPELDPSQWVQPASRP